MSNLKLEISMNVNELISDINKYTTLQYAIRSRLAMLESIERVKELVSSNMREDTGVTKASLQTMLRGTSVDLEGVIGSNDFNAKVMEFGRGENQPMPPKWAIYAWLQRHGGGDINTAFVVAKRIGIKGIPGVHMFQRAYDIAQVEVPLIWKRYF
jgi:hypothetical protein